MAWGWWQGMLGPRDILPGGTQCPLGIPEPSAEEAAWLQPPRPAPPSPPMPAPLSPGESDAPGPAEHSEAVSKGLSLLKTGRWRLAERAAGRSKADPRSPPPPAESPGASCQQSPARPGTAGSGKRQSRYKSVCGLHRANSAARRSRRWQGWHGAGCGESPAPQPGLPGLGSS